MTTASSWRDQVAPQVRDELDELLDVSVRAAQQRLEASGTYPPFGVALRAAGDSLVVTPEVRTGARQVADVAEVFEACWSALVELREGVRAAAVVTDVVGPDGDAIAVALEHRDGPAVEVFLPYERQRKTRGGKKPAQKVLYGDLEAVPGTVRVWAG